MTGMHAPQMHVAHSKILIDLKQGPNGQVKGAQSSILVILE